MTQVIIRMKCSSSARAGSTRPGTGCRKLHPRRCVRVGVALTNTESEGNASPGRQTTASPRARWPVSQERNSPRMMEQAQPNSHVTAHRRLPVLEENGFVQLRDYEGELDPAEWETMEYMDWKSGGDTNFAPIASALGEMECAGFWDHGKSDKDGIWTKNAEIC